MIDVDLRSDSAVFAGWRVAAALLPAVALWGVLALALCAWRRRRRAGQPDDDERGARGEREPLLSDLSDRLLPDVPPIEVRRERPGDREHELLVQQTLRSLVRRSFCF